MNGWKTARIESFCTVGAGGTPPRDSIERYYAGGTIPWVKSGELRETIIADTEEHITEAALRETNVKLVPTGALLLAMYGATVGRLGILGVPATTNQAVCHIIPDPTEAEVRYLFHALSNQTSNLVARGVGGRSRISAKAS
jgi:type I restriction enzyme, S subunit